MGRLRILGAGGSSQAQAQVRGALFEQLMAIVLKHHGYRIDSSTRVNYGGMEIDIEGRSTLTEVPLYAECKCHDTDVTAPDLQQFFGKYMTRWMRNKQSQGLFIALPGINSHAKAFYNENCREQSDIAFKILEEDDVLAAMYASGVVTNPEWMAETIPAELGARGDSTILYTEHGCFVIQYIIPEGSGIANSIAVLDARCHVVTNAETIDYLTQLYPELETFENLFTSGEAKTRDLKLGEDTDQIVEVRGSSACFEYQFPASPEFFVGREDIMRELEQFTGEIINKTTSARGVLFEAYSGWGKSSVVLASVAWLRQRGHHAIAIDSRTASTSQFILRAVDYAINGSGALGENSREALGTRIISGFDGGVETLIELGKTLEEQGKVFFIFFDQFENVFSLLDALGRIRDLFVKLVDAETNVVFGFSWKTDLVGSTNEFPYQMRDSIANNSKKVGLVTFSEVETAVLLNRLAEELGAPVRKELRYFLSEFSQGYPWLLKKLCAHVKTQREAGVSQQDIVDSLLNVQELFDEDLRGLSSEQDDTLRRIARMAPVTMAELGEDFKPEVVQSLVDARLIVRVGPKYDIYWDIFRDYLNGGRVPVQENYILHISPRSILIYTRLLADNKGLLNISEFQELAHLSEGSRYNVFREMRLLGLANVAQGEINSQVDFPLEKKEFEEGFREHLRNRLRRNRIVSQLLKALENEETLTINAVAERLMGWCPYISASGRTWLSYARLFSEWMDAADLATYDKKESTLDHYSSGSELRERDLLQGRSRGGVVVPLIQYAPIVKVSVRIVDALRRRRGVDWDGIPKTTRAKALTMLQELGFITHNAGRIRVTQSLLNFADHPDARAEMFAARALNMNSFDIFLEILNGYDGAPWSLYGLGAELKQLLHMDWSDGTCQMNAKVMLNWARYTGLAPSGFESRWGKNRAAKQVKSKVVSGRSRHRWAHPRTAPLL